jgi:hypothetical protein
MGLIGFVWLLAFSCMSLLIPGPYVAWVCRTENRVRRPARALVEWAWKEKSLSIGIRMIAWPILKLWQ